MGGVGKRVDGIGYESVTPAKLKRIDLPDEKARKAGLPPKCVLKADKDGGRIIVDMRLQTRQPFRARMDPRPIQRKETQDPTIREKFNT